MAECRAADRLGTIIRHLLFFPKVVCSKLPAAGTGFFVALGADELITELDGIRRTAEITEEHWRSIAHAEIDH